MSLAFCFLGPTRRPAEAISSARCRPFPIAGTDAPPGGSAGCIAAQRPYAFFEAQPNANAPAAVMRELKQQIMDELKQQIKNELKQQIMKELLPEVMYEWTCFRSDAGLPGFPERGNVDRNRHSWNDSDKEKVRAAF